MENKQSISELEKKLAGSLEDLESTTRVFGERLLTDAAKMDVSEHPVSQADVDTWRELKEKRQNITENILRVKQIVGRLDELKGFSSEAEKKTKEQGKKLAKMQSEFVMTFYKHFKHEGLPCFQTLAQGNSKIQSDLDEAESQLEQINAQMKEATIFQKIGLTPKMLTAQAKQKMAVANMKKVFEKTGLTVFESSDFQDAVNSKETLPTELSDMQHEILTTLTVKKEAGLKFDALSEEKNKLYQELESLEAKNNPSKHISAQTKIMQEYDKKTDDLCKTAGQNYVNSFFDSVGVQTSEQSISDDEPYSETVKNIAGKRTGIEKTKCSIEHLKTQKKIAEKEKEIANNKNKIEKCKDTIEKQHRLIQESEKTIEKAEKEKVDMTEYAESLKQKI